MSASSAVYRRAVVAQRRVRTGHLHEERHLPLPGAASRLRHVFQAATGSGPRQAK